MYVHGKIIERLFRIKIMKDAIIDIEEITHRRSFRSVTSIQFILPQENLIWLHVGIVTTTSEVKKVEVLIHKRTPSDIVNKVENVELIRITGIKRSHLTIHLGVPGKDYRRRLLPLNS